MILCSWDSFVEPESIARLIDAFVNSLNLKKYEGKEMAKEGRPPYDPRGMYKLYIYGNRKGIRSSRKLAESCKVNLEVKWMIGGVEPDFRTIADFPGKNAPEDVPVGASVWNDKKSDGSQPLSVKRIAEGGRRICALLSGI